MIDGCCRCKTGARCKQSDGLELNVIITIFRVPIGAYLACSMAWGWEHPALPGNIAFGVVRAAPRVLCNGVGLLLPLLGSPVCCFVNTQTRVTARRESSLFPLSFLSLSKVQVCCPDARKGSTLARECRRRGGICRQVGERAESRERGGVRVRSCQPKRPFLFYLIRGDPRPRALACCAFDCCLRLAAPLAALTPTHNEASPVKIAALSLPIDPDVATLSPPAMASTILRT